MIPKIAESAGNVLTGVPFDDTDTASVIWDDFTTKLDALARARCEGKPSRGGS